MMVMIKRVFFWGISVSITAMLLYLIFPEQILQILTNDSQIIESTKTYLFWTLLIPLAGFAAFLWDGIFIGATASKEMRNTMIISALVFFTSYYILTPLWGNNGLWFSFILYLLVRGVIQTFLSKRALNL